MPIEFACSSCQKTLRVPSESAGQRARCPQCGNIQVVPAESLSAGTNLPPVSPPVPPSGQPGPSVNPFGDAANRDPFSSPPPKNWGASSAPTNPYASPAVTETLVKNEDGPLKHRLLSFEHALNTTWEIFKQNLGPLIAVCVITLGINFGINIVGNVIGAIAQATGEVAAVVIAQIFIMIMSFISQTFLQLGNILFCLNVSRQRKPNIPDLFAGGPFLLPACLTSLLVSLMIGGLVLLCSLPAIGVAIAQGQAIEKEPAPLVIAVIVGVLVAFPVLIWLTYRWLFALIFVVDRKTGVMQSLALSTEFTQGNKLTIFLVTLVAGFAASLFTFATCCLGIILAVPFITLLPVVMYLQATGQLPEKEALSQGIPQPIQFPKNL